MKLKILLLAILVGLGFSLSAQNTAKADRKKNLTVKEYKQKAGAVIPYLDDITRYDANGRKVPKEIAKLHEKRDGEETLTLQERTWVHPQSQAVYHFEYPFRILDREADLRAAYAKYEPLLNTTDQPE